MKTITVDEFKRLGGTTVLFAPGGQHGTVPVDEGVAIVCRLDNERFEVLDTKPSQAAADLAIQEAAADAYTAYMERAPESAATATRDLVARHGFEIWHTGGGCLAWGMALDEGGELLLTDDDGGITAEVDAPVWSIGRYDAEGRWVVTGPYTVEMALLIAPTILPPEFYGEEEVVWTPEQFSATEVEMWEGERDQYFRFLDWLNLTRSETFADLWAEFGGPDDEDILASAWEGEEEQYFEFIDWLNVTRSDTFSDLWDAFARRGVSLAKGVAAAPNNGGRGPKP